MPRHRRENPDSGTALLLLGALAAAGGAAWYYFKQRGVPPVSTVCPQDLCPDGSARDPVTCQCPSDQPATGECPPGTTRAADGVCSGSLGPVRIIFQ